MPETPTERYERLLAEHRYLPDLAKCLCKWIVPEHPWQANHAFAQHCAHMAAVLADDQPQHTPDRDTLAKILAHADDRWQHGIGSSGYDMTSERGYFLMLADAVRAALDPDNHGGTP